MMTRKKPLMVVLEAREPSVVELTINERVQLDRVAEALERHIAAPRLPQLAERLGPVLLPGVHQVALDAGRFCFRTLSDAHLRVVQGGVSVVAQPSVKDPPPSALAAPSIHGDDPPGEQPTLTVA